MKKLYLDMDGVLTNFVAEFSRHYGLESLKNRDKKLWTEDWPNFILVKRGFENLPWYPGGKEMIRFAKQIAKKGIPVEILTSTGGESYHNEVKKQKNIWLKKQGITFKSNMVPGRKKKRDYAGPGIVLVDDTLDVVESFNKAGGIGIHHTNLGDTVEKLKALLA